MTRQAALLPSFLGIAETAQGKFMKLLTTQPELDMLGLFVPQAVGRYRKGRNRPLPRSFTLDP